MLQWAWGITESAWQQAVKFLSLIKLHTEDHVVACVGKLNQDNPSLTVATDQLYEDSEVLPRGPFTN
jgi:hypothetical protein